MGGAVTNFNGVGRAIRTMMRDALVGRLVAK